jgi:hypothetical protein
VELNDVNAGSFPITGAQQSSRHADIDNVAERKSHPKRVKSSQTWNLTNNLQAGLKETDKCFIILSNKLSGNEKGYAVLVHPRKAM